MDNRQMIRLHNDSLRLCWMLTALYCLCGCSRNDKPIAPGPVAADSGNTVVDRKASAHAPADANPIVGNPHVAPPDQLPAACLRWPIPKSQAPVAGTVTVEELQNEYRTSRAATDAKHNGKLLEISGRVLFVGNNLGGEPTVQLEGSDKRFVVRCVLRSVNDSVHAVQGETCRLTGVYCISTLPILIHCTVIPSAEPQETPAIETPAESTVTRPRTPEVILTAEQLDAEFADDSQKAIQKYAGRVMQITGRVSRVSEIAGEMRYHLGARPMVISTQYFVRNGNPWYCVRPGQTVTLLGEGYSVYPCLINCEVIKVSGKPLPTLPAVLLGKYLESDRVGFRNRFYLLQLTVSGEVIQKAPSKTLTDHIEVTLRSTTNTSVTCEMIAEEAMATESVRIGDSVTITGWNTKETPTDSIILAQSQFWRGE